MKKDEPGSTALGIVHDRDLVHPLYKLVSPINILYQKARVDHRRYILRPPDIHSR